jgi:DNA polymerase-3 subunit delta'
MTRDSSASTLLPWHVPRWEILNRARRAGRFPHALLVTGAAGVGKRRLVSVLTGSLLCRNPGADGIPCGECTDCRLLAAGTHPDLIEVGPDPDSKSDEIKVDAVRRLRETDAKTAHQGGWKVILIDPAQNMNQNAANGLLKTLEEPTPGTLFCLVCAQPSRLPATIRSRCQEVAVPLPPEPVALEWLGRHTDSGSAARLLRLACGAPLRALALADSEQLSEREQICTGFAAVARGERDPIAEAGSWNRYEPELLLDWLSGWVCDLLLLASGHKAPRVINADAADVLKELAGRVDRSAGHRYLQRVLSARAEQGANTNRLLMYECLLVELAEIARR